ncbi:MAG: glycoside hydrolase family 2 sugar binding protein [Microbacteriaceae bacterium]|nr:glycoside hydrolase family 2 sugar binding protein [Microbacteriaceae bacterium]
MLQTMTIASRESLEEEAALVRSDAIPRAEYPRPQFVRADWLCLNGEWEFTIDGSEGAEPSAFNTIGFDRTITVPFAPESRLSGVVATGFLEAVWYRRTVEVPTTWDGRRVLLNFQACDYDTSVWVNGSLVGSHRGGFTPFSFDISDAVAADRLATIVVRARDENAVIQPRGKQSRRAENYEAFYTRSTGIWQTVWMEPVSATRLERPRITPDLDAGTFQFDLNLTGHASGATVDVIVRDHEREVARCSTGIIGALGATTVVQIPKDRRIAWSPKNPHLYDIEFIVRDGDRVLDRVSSYSGLRSIAIEGKRVLLNGESLFQRLVLDQGWYPDGLMTAPTEAALVADIELAMSAGFNGARLHQKVFEERYLYHADRLGYLVWGEFADWGARENGRQIPTATFITQWIEAVNRDYSHPSIIGWCPLNETFEPLTENITVLDDVTNGMYYATKAIDRTRPVLDASGYSHRVEGADVYDSHSYEQNPVAFAEQMAGLAEGHPFVNNAEDGTEWSISYAGQPYFCSEFGGIWWSATESASTGSWGYGEAPLTVDEWYQRAEGLFEVLLSDPSMFGYCFTQLTDVFQEKNGIFTFDREPKFDLGRIRALHSRPAAIEAGPIHPATLDPDE